jgi:hypothetical protein
MITSSFMNQQLQPSLKQFSTSFLDNGGGLPIAEQHEDESSFMNISTNAQLQANNLSTMIEHYSTNSANSSLLQGYRPSFGSGAGRN